MVPIKNQCRSQRSKRDAMSYSRIDGEAVTSVAVTMPDTGSRSVARVIAWRRGRGERVDAHEPLCLVAWDDVTAEVESPAAGVLQTLVAATGQPIATGATLARVDVPATGSGPRQQIA